MNRIALDTNILIYLYDLSDEKKRRLSESLLADKPFISSQVVSEFLNVTKRLQKWPKYDTLKKCTELMVFCEIIPLNHRIMEKVLAIIQEYDFQLFDSIIVASALEAGCNILYSEDLQHRQQIENRLIIINPFL